MTAGHSGSSRADSLESNHSEPTETMRLAPGRLASAIRSLNAEERTVEVVWSTGARVRRQSWSDGPFLEELSMDPSHIRLERMNDGAAFLDSHEQFGISNRIGAVVPGTVRVEGGKGYATLKLSRSAVGNRLLEDLADGIPLPISVGYKVHLFEKLAGEEGELPVLRAIDWEPMEVSAVTVPADAGAAARTEPSQSHECIIVPTKKASKKQESPMSPAPEPAERERRLAIHELAQRYGWSKRKANSAIELGRSVDDVRAAILDDLTTADERRSTGPSVIGGTDEPGDHHRAEALVEALFHRIAPTKELSPLARQYRHLSLVQVAAQRLEETGGSTRGESPSRIIQRALATTDYPIVLGSLLNRSLRAGYEGARSDIKRIARQVTARDFRPRHAVQVSGDAELVTKNENGEYLTAYFNETKESYRVQTYGRIFRCTREVLINDDLGFFDRVPLIFGRKAAEKENQIVAKLLIDNPNVEDGKSLFHADHGNLAAAGSVISHASLSAAAIAMARQKSMDGKEKVAVRPAYLIVPPELTMVARQVLSTVAATTVEDVNVWAGKLELIEEPTLENPAGWYLAADPAEFDTIEYAYLEGEEGVQTETQRDFETDNVNIKARLDFGAGVVDHRGLYFNPGAAS